MQFTSETRKQSMTTDPLIGKKLGDYVIVDLLGHGGMARVYRGFDEKLNRYAAVKVFDAHLIGEGDQDEYRIRFQNEARSIARLNHPNIVGVYQFDHIGTTYYMAMSIIEGRDLRSHIKGYAKNSTYMSYMDVLRIVRDIGSALDYAHDEGVIHRDIKPSNIMVMPSGRAVLTDFGLALNVSEGTIGATFGSAHYIAPEQALSSAQAVPQSDLYSLGVVLFEMLTNRVPFSDPSAMTVAMKHINDAPPRPSEVNPNLSSPIDEVVLKALHKKPDQRFESGAAFVQALQLALLQSADKSGRPMLVQELPSWESDSWPSTRSRSTAPGSTSQRSTMKLEGLTNEQGVPSLLDDLSPVTEAKVANATRLGMILHQRGKRVWAALAVVIFLAGAVVAIGLLTSSREQAVSNQNATRTAEGMIVIGTTEEADIALSPTQVIASVIPTDEPTIEPTATTAPSLEPTTERASVSLAGVLGEATEAVTVPATSTHTPTVTHTPSPMPTKRPTASVPPATVEDGEGGEVMLWYDENKLVLFNRSQADVDVSGLTFVQVKADGTELVFESERWEGGSRPPASLPPGDCFEVFRDSEFVNDPAEGCATRHAWSRVTFPRWFWVSDETAAVFEVRRGEMVLATCAIRAGKCTLDVTVES